MKENNSLRAFLVLSLQNPTVYHYQSHTESVESTTILIITGRFLEEDISCGYPVFYSTFNSRDHFIAKLYNDKNT